MDQVSDTTRDTARARRRRMRQTARSQHVLQTPVSDRYQTPQWLERSFVLPLTQPEASDVPSQSVPRHDDHLPRPTDAAVDEPGEAPDETATVDAPTEVTRGPEQPGRFVRPPTDHIDFARVVRRSDLCRRTGRLSWAFAGLTGLALIAYLLLSSVVMLVVLVLVGLVSVTAFAVHLRLARAPIPRLQR